MRRTLALAMALSCGTYAAAQVTVTMNAYTSFSGGWVDHTEGNFGATTGGLERGLAYNPVTNSVIVVTRNAGLHARIFDGVNAARTDVTFAGAISGGTFTGNMIGISNDGQIYLANLATTSASSFYKIYKYANQAAIGTGYAYSGSFNVLSGARIGDTLDVFGSGNNVSLVAGFGTNAGIGGTNSYGVFTDDGSALNGSAVSMTGTNSGDFRLGITFGGSANQVFGTQGGNFRRTSYTGTAGTLDGSNAVGAAERIMDYAVVGGIPLLALMDTNSSIVRIYDMTDPTNLTLKASMTTIVGTSVGNGNGTGSVKFGAISGNTAVLYALNTNNGVQAFTVQAVPEPGTMAALGLGVVALLRRRRKA